MSEAIVIFDGDGTLRVVIGIDPITGVRDVRREIEISDRIHNNFTSSFFRFSLLSILKVAKEGRQDRSSGRSRKEAVGRD
jgi:hypothetical protein